MRLLFSQFSSVSVVIFDNSCHGPAVFDRPWFLRSMHDLPAGVARGEGIAAPFAGELLDGPLRLRAMPGTSVETSQRTIRSSDPAHGGEHPHGP